MYGNNHNFFMVFTSPSLTVADANEMQANITYATVIVESVGHVQPHYVTKDIFSSPLLSCFQIDHCNCKYKKMLTFLNCHISPALSLPPSFSRQVAVTAENVLLIQSVKLTPKSYTSSDYLGHISGSCC